MLKKNKVVIIKEPNCLNCGYPFNGQEKFCPDCGQKNKKAKITFKSFLAEVFNGFISWDAKFWKTIVPLLISPGKVSKDYIEGKRVRYTNPFRFYLTVSILFFLVLGFINTYQNFTDLNKDEATVTTPSQINFSDPTKNLTKKELDSINTTIKTQLSKELKNVDSTTKKQILNLVPDLDSTAIKEAGKRNLNINFGTRISRMKKFQYKNPQLPIQTALDSLKIEKTFFNKFLYTRVNVINSWETSNGKEFFKQLISYASVSLFVLLPIFTLFIKFVYIRRKFTYVEHLVFVFHTQTVFFILLILFLIIYSINHNSDAWLVFTGAFLIYLFLAMKKFYRQGYIKTFIKYSFVNFVFVILAAIGVAIISFTAFILS
ncbi:hypothetical protein WH52_03645 [Tenacibaculum holothuriorum]|uniref:DUF3667 domain-containing protein n=1 Tax=Tenacibaculum holothuriorum TaxID=1635173 RepID=A0A1Y2PE45_9FLAO|nr:DUF3667 domain-containing protein [Tenacibaculum holothuriorum]OSY88774.1 hypothetical protein WH52_03645 [Tenacibaculum holothuriorum]